MENSRPTLLCILDGFGLNPNPRGNAVAAARKPHFETLWNTCPHTTLTTFGERVGLPEGQMGNSEVGHLNIGAGRVVEQWLLRISRSLNKENSVEWQTLNKFAGQFRPAGGKLPTIHVIGLFSEGGVHSHISHLELLLEKLGRATQAKIGLHVVTDGRDCSPRAALPLVDRLQKKLGNQDQVQIASIVGRFYAMDRDKRWDRTEAAFKAIALAQGTQTPAAGAWLENSYSKDIGDEFIEPAVVKTMPILPEDGILFWNFREDRMRQIVAALAQSNFEHFERKYTPPHPQNVLCFTEYDHTFKLPYIFEQVPIKNHLGEYLSDLGFAQLRVAETEKYPHVTYFFNGGIEKPYPNETRRMVPSPREVRTYDQKPEMSAAGVTDIVVDAILSQKYKLIVVNLANCDMVGHTGVLEAAVMAVETVDNCLGRMKAALDKVDGQAVIIADHGNAEQMINYEDGSPHTSHTMYPVPLVIYSKTQQLTLKPDGALSDVAPTLLMLMGLPLPLEMTGQSLISD